MSLFRPSRLGDRLAKNDDPLKKKNTWLKSCLCAAIMAAFGVFFLLAYGEEFLVFGCVLLASAVLFLLDGLVTKNRK